MNISSQIVSGLGGGLLVLLYLLFIGFWMVLAWRLVKAQERAANSLDEIRLAVRTWFQTSNR